MWVMFQRSSIQIWCLASGCAQRSLIDLVTVFGSRRIGTVAFKSRTRLLQKHFLPRPTHTARHGVYGMLGLVG